MLTVSEILQQLRANAAGEVINRSATVAVDQPAEPVVASKARQKATRTTSTRDVPAVALKLDGAEVEFTVDDLDPSAPRWVYALTAGSSRLSGVVNGAGDVLRVADLAHELAGLGEVVRNAPPTRLGNMPSRLESR